MALKQVDTMVCCCAGITLVVLGPLALAWVRDCKVVRFMCAQKDDTASDNKKRVLSHSHT